MQTNCAAYAKVVVNSRLNMLRVLVTFENIIGRNGLRVVNVRNAVYKSGDLCSVSEDSEVRDSIIQREVARIRNVLRTSNVLFGA